MYAANCGEFKIIEFLLHYITDYTIKNEDDDTAFDIAVKNNNIEISKLLFKNEFKDIFAQDEKITYLMVAAINYRMNALKMFLTLDDLCKLNSQGKTALMLAAENN